MRRIIFIIVITLCSAGCATTATKDISEKLDKAKIYRVYNVSATNLASRSKCETLPTVKIINDETRTDEYEVLENPPFYGVVNPKELMDSVVLYLKDGFAESNIKSDDKSSKIIKIKMVELKSVAGFWSFGSHCKLSLTIPEINFTNSYEAYDNSGAGYAAAAYAIHSVTRKIIEDTEVQDYILCK